MDCLSRLQKPITTGHDVLKTAPRSIRVVHPFLTEKRYCLCQWELRMNMVRWLRHSDMEGRPVHCTLFRCMIPAASTTYNLWISLIVYIHQRARMHRRSPRSLRRLLFDFLFGLLRVSRGFVKISMRSWKIEGAWTYLCVLRLAVFFLNKIIIVIVPLRIG